MMTSSFSSIVAKLAALPSLERVIEDEPEQLQYWYEQLVELELPDQLEGVDNAASGFQDIDTVFQSMRLIMQYEHTNAEELKEVAEREAVEMAEKEENWEMERDMLKEEISALRERITSKAGIDETNEAFRDEIDSLTTENAYLKQLGRERDRELADQTGKAEELSSRVETLEKERGLFVNNQAQLEDTIRELNRRISSKNDVSQMGEWESRKLRQRNEQAVLLSDQLQNVISQNDQLKSEVDRMSEALENGTALLQDSAAKYADYGKQLAFAEKSIERLLADNKQLKAQLNDRDSQLTEREQHVTSFSKEFHTVLQAKNAQIDQLREEAQKNELEIEKLRARLELLHNQDREEELERLRTELVSATETARKLFGAAIAAEEESSSSHKTALDPLADLRLRLLQMDKQLEAREQQVKLLSQDKTDMQAALEHKDLANARLNAQNQRLRQMAFGEADGEVVRLEKQLEFRDRHLQQLTHTCTLLQIQLHQLQDKELVGKTEEEAGEHKQQAIQSIQPKKQKKGAAKIAFKTLEKVEKVKAVAEDQRLESPSDEQPQEETEEAVDQRPATTYFMKPQVRQEVEANAAVLKSLYQEIVQLVQNVEDKDKELEQARRLHQEMQTLLANAKKETSVVQTELTDLREMAYGTGEQEEAVLDENTLQLSNQQLSTENMELKRLFETLKTGGSELERRMAESTRRLIFLAIQNSRLERKTETEQRLKKAISLEMGRLNERLQRLSLGEQKQSRQIIAENEVNLVEVARLQNALLHSVPLAEYNRLLKDFKQLVHAQTVGGGRSGSSDAGYQSAEDETSQAYQFSISQGSILLMSEGRTADQILLNNRRLEELNQVLEGQNEYWQRECQKHKAELQELTAFLSDLENETEVKSMIANIERRFLQALREQFDSVQEQMISEKQLANLEKQLNKRKREWRLERQHLVNVVVNLQSVLRRQIANTPLPISMEQLVTFSKSMQTLRQKQLSVEQKATELNQTSAQLQTKVGLAESARASILEILANDYQLQHMQATLQGYHLNIITLSDQVSKLRAQLEKVNAETIEKDEQVNQLNQQLQTFNLTNVDLDWLVAASHKELEDREQQLEGNKPQKANSKEGAEMKSSSSDSSLEDTGKAAQLWEVTGGEQAPKAVLIFDNSSQYEGHIKNIKEAAKLCVKNYQEQLEQKENAIQEYKALLEGLQAKAEEPCFYQQPDKTDPPVKSSAELLNNLNLEEKELRIVALEHQVRELEQANGELGEQLSASTQRRSHKHVAIQVNSTNKASPTRIAIKTNQTDQQQDFEEEEGIDTSNSESSRGKEEASDSGTVEDIEDKRCKKNSSRSNSTGSIDKRRPSGGTHTLLRPATSSALEPETLLLRHRNETRRLRLRIVALEKRNKQLVDENISYRERTKFSTTRKPLDPNSEAALFKNDHDRLVRENKNLGNSLKHLKEELESLEKKLKKSESSIQSKISSELWEERKRHSQATSNLKQRIYQLETEEKELNDRILRRDKLIEQLNKDNSSRYVDTDRLNTLLKEWRQERAALEKKERELRTELEVAVEKHKSANCRLEMLVKENKSLQSRLGRLQEKLTQPEIKKSVMPEVRHREVQTYNDFGLEKLKMGLRPPGSQSSKQMTQTNLEISQNLIQPTARKEDIQWEEQRTNTTQKQLRKAELLQQETTEQLNTLKAAYEELMKNYNALFRLDIKKQRQNVRVDGEETAACTVLKDKLLAKNREIEIQRHKIAELEKRLWSIGLKGYA